MWSIDSNLSTFPHSFTPSAHFDAWRYDIAKNCWKLYVGNHQVLKVSPKVFELLERPCETCTRESNFGARCCHWAVFLYFFVSAKSSLEPRLINTDTNVWFSEVGSKFKIVFSNLQIFQYCQKLPAKKQNSTSKYSLLRSTKHSNLFYLIKFVSIIWKFFDFNEISSRIRCSIFEDDIQLI